MARGLIEKKNNFYLGREYWKMERLRATWQKPRSMTQAPSKSPPVAETWKNGPMTQWPSHLKIAVQIPEGAAQPKSEEGCFYVAFGIYFLADQTAKLQTQIIFRVYQEGYASLGIA